MIALHHYKVAPLRHALHFQADGLITRRPRALPATRGIGQTPWDSGSAPLSRYQEGRMNLFYIIGVVVVGSFFCAISVSVNGCTQESAGCRTSTQQCSPLTGCKF